MVLNVLISILIMVAVGALAGVTARFALPGKGLGLWKNTVVGVTGSVLAGFLIPLPLPGILDAFVGSLIGAIIVLALLKCVDSVKVKFASNESSSNTDDNAV